MFGRYVDVMPPSGVPPNAERIREHVDEALQGLELDPAETAEILGFANEEVPHLQTPESSYLVLGSFRSPYERRLRIVENELNKQIGTYAFALGDVRQIDVDRLPTFRVRFYIIASYADGIAAVYEQDAGGEVTELGKISETPFFQKSSVLPRDYAWMTDRTLETESQVSAGAIQIAANEDLDSDEIEQELETLVETAQTNGIDVSVAEVCETVRERKAEGPDVPTYSWVHVNEFRLFELHGRCFPWVEVEELRAAAAQIPRQSS